MSRALWSKEKERKKSVRGFWSQGSCWPILSMKQQNLFVRGFLLVCYLWMRNFNSCSTGKKIHKERKIWRRVRTTSCCLIVYIKVNKFAKNVRKSKESKILRKRVKKRKGCFCTPKVLLGIWKMQASVNDSVQVWLLVPSHPLRHTV